MSEMIVKLNADRVKIEGCEYVQDLVRCADCEYAEYRAGFDDYECHESGCGLVHTADWYCAGGVRSEQ